jgi:GH15 family glucan-1,4-alpha-glucosidase
MMTDPDRVPLGARGLIGDTASAALVAADGTIDWYCPGRLDSPAALYRILDPTAGGAIRVGPARLGPSARRQLPPGGQGYDPSTNVLRTRLVATDGELEVADFMPWPGGTERPPGRIVRLVTALRGPVEVEISVIPGWAWRPAEKVSTWSTGMVFGGTASGGLAVRCGLPLEAVEVRRSGAEWRATRVLEAGEQLVVTVDDATDDHHRPLSPDAAASLLEATADAWRRHVFPVTYDGPFREAVIRSLLAVKLLQWYGSGAVAAAATTSLPEVAGGERNEERRLAWIRDASAAASIFARVGLIDDGRAAEEWLRVAVSDTFLPVYDLEGGPPPPPEELAWLPGRLHSQPVRTGTPWADPSFLQGGGQFDAYGDLFSVLEDGRPLSGAWKEMVGLADDLASSWAAPDRGFWELRGRPYLLVASRVQAWYALDRMARLARARNPLDLDAASWQQTASEIARWLDTNALASDGGVRMAPELGDLPDAALLRLAWRGPWPAVGAPMVGRTVERILLQLSTDALIHRYSPEVDDGLPGTPGADMGASFWAVRALAELGRWEEAHDRMETLTGLGVLGPLGVLGESVDPLSGQLLGNLPSARAHLALIDAALALTRGPL